MAKLPELSSLRLVGWAHMLGFRGHFSTKSRAYSTTFSALRAERIQHQREHATDDSLWPASEADNTLVIAHWQFARRGHSPVTPLPADRRRPRLPIVQPDEGRPVMTRLLLTVPEAAEALAISRSKLYELLAAGLVRSVRIDGSRRVPVEALETYVATLLDQEEAIDAQAS